MNARSPVDLHLHSTASDGMLDPAALVAHVAGCGVRLMALTDHDTVAGIEAAAGAAREHGIAFVAGVELSAAWRGKALHVLGLAIDPVLARAHARARRPAGDSRRARRTHRGQSSRPPGRPAARRSPASARTAACRPAPISPARSSRLVPRPTTARHSTAGLAAASPVMSRAPGRRSRKRRPGSSQPAARR